MPVATSSRATPGGPLRPAVGGNPAHPFFTSDEEGAVTDASEASRQPRRRGRRRGRGRQTDGSETDASTTSNASATRRFRKKSGVNSKIELVKFGGKKGHPVMWMTPSELGPDVSCIREPTMKMSTSCLKS